ncbi:MAG TPA: DUF192 domain-containing protein [Candidatus Elarobacter sp.]|nr:DUF192 domain-containing protein [Candidatus Elarobacter sp.]HEV2740857.1 DUF192 domain-containing protein [Candidatus Elarobacter sp.]
MRKSTTHSLIALGALLALTAQSPAPAATPAAQSWCTRLPLPRPDLPAMKVEGNPVHRGHAAECRVLEVRAGRTMLRLAVAATNAQREHGLMNVPFVPAGEGMLFAFPGSDELRGFWMKDTITPLDMVFVRTDGTITMIAENVPATKPGTPDDKVARRQALAKYVIELGARESERIGLEPGMQLYIEAVDAK